MTSYGGLRNESRIAILVLAAMLTTGFVINQPALAANNGNGNNGNNGNGDLIANNQSVSVDENSSVAITLTGSGPSGFTYMISSGPMHGALTGTAPNMTYIPATDYVGTDSFTFYTHKGGNDSTAASVNITINEVVVNPSPPVTCDEGFHAEGDVCVPNIVEEETPVLTCDEGFHAEDAVCVPDVVEELPVVLTCDEGFHAEGEACVADNEETEEGSNDENEGSEDEQQTTAAASSGKNRSLVMAAAESLREMDGSIPESITGLDLYDAVIGSTGINLLSAMKAVTAAGMDWNGLTEAQQVWVIENFNGLLN
jgi:hypothetical protein